MNNVRIGHILKEEGVISEVALDFCLSVQKSNGHERLGQVLRNYDFVSEEHIVHALAKQVGWDVFKGDYKVANEMVEILGVDFMLKHLIYPCTVDDSTVFVMAYSDDMSATDYVQEKVQGKACFMLAPEKELRQAIERVALLNYQCLKDVVCDEGEGLPQWFDQCLLEAIKKGATDIHVEPSIKTAEVRFRIDGILHFYQSLKVELLKRLVNIVFHKAEVTISDFGKFHDARFSYLHDGASVDVRVSHIPSVKGSSLALRLLDKSKTSFSLIDLGYPQGVWEKIQTALVKPEGMVLIVGPTGCGKTTTLYAMLNFLKGIERKIITIEDPVEMHHPLITQVQTHEKRGINFGNAVRAFLRHDPNIILIGEIRDELTAHEAIRASMSGHKVFATLHANKAIDAFLRLKDLGVPLTHLGSNISMVIAQRLVRLLCPFCRQLQPVTDQLPLGIAHTYAQGQKQTYAPAGCSKCNGGYKGRTVITSLIICDETVEELLLKENLVGLKQYLKPQGVFVSMKDQVIELIQQGKTSIQEAVRVVG